MGGAGRSISQVPTSQMAASHLPEPSTNPVTQEFGTFFAVSIHKHVHVGHHHKLTALDCGEKDLVIGNFQG
jgi:hypothetical protein